ncbi:VOC family protein [Caulobacter mirabilis]|uniref:Glyoxalase n=1 Tax=Caulobacter mirabilis TaxID=69666 RepID=A0A2D2B2F0_9CAUL|nr:VOC family protein [Caulobacter mirabilis]ATQ44431.1 glyoxalase [Caulobacter mirabilis]
MIDSLDHVAVVVHDLDAAVDGYTRLLGRAPNWRGADGGAHHAWFQLGNAALDVIAPTGEGYTGNQIQARLASHGEGLWALAFGTPDMATARRRLERVGIASSEPLPIRSTHPETGEKRRWLTSVADAGATHGANLFLIETSPEAWPISPVTVDEGSSVAGLDHVVVQTPNPDRAAALYGARLDLDMKLDRSNPDWGMRLMFFRVADLIVEIAHPLKDGVSNGPDKVWGLSWRVANVAAAHDRMGGQRVEVSPIRPGRKPGTSVFTVKGAPGGVPTLVIGPAQ